MSMLDEKEHSRIIADFEKVCTVAGVQGRFLYDSMTKHCGPLEVEWVKNFWQYRAEGLPGLVLENIKQPDSRCQAMAAALLRNYLDARVIPINTLLDMASDVGVPTPTVLFVPNMYLTALSKNMPAWRVQMMYDILLERATKGKPSVVYVENLKSLITVFGSPFRDFLGSFRLISEV